MRAFLLQNLRRDGDRWRWQANLEVLGAELPEDRVLFAGSQRSEAPAEALPRPEIQQARELMRWEAEQHVPFDMESVELDFQILDPGKGAGRDEGEKPRLSVRGGPVERRRQALPGLGDELDTLESEGQMLQRVMPGLMGMKGVMVLNDEAHHCYREKPQPEDMDKLKGEEKDPKVAMQKVVDAVQAEMKKG